MPKIINLKPEEEITSAVEYLWETGANEVYFVAPRDSVFLRNIIGLKLLKREAERLGKTVILITKDEIGREMAKRVGLASRAIMPKVSEMEESEELPEGDVLRELPPKKFESLLEEEVEIKRRAAPRPWRMSDIKPKEVEAEKVKEILPPPEEPVEEEIVSVEPETVGPAFFESQDVEIQEEEFLPEIPAEALQLSGKKREMAEELSADSVKAARKERKKIWRLVKNCLVKFGQFLARALKSSKDHEERKALAAPAIPTKFFIIFIGAAVLIAALVLYFILPRAEINITPKTAAFSQDLNLVADKGMAKPDFTQNKIPAQLIKLDKKQSQEFSATGQRQLNEKARGTITIFNEYSSSPQVLVEKTRFVSESGKVFRLTKSITVPGAKIQEGKIVASSIDAQVAADQAGAEYNIGPSKFTIPGFQGSPKYTTFYARSGVAMSGGAVGVFKIVSQEDFDKAKNELWQSLQPALDREFKAQIPAGFKIIDNALQEEMGSVSSDVGVGGQAEKFTLTLKGTATVLLFDEKDILAIATQKMVDKIKDSQPTSGKIDQIDYSNSQADFSKGQLSFGAKINGKITCKVASDQLQKELAGKNENEIKEIIARHPEIDKAQVIFWPFWVKSVPSNLDKIKVKIN